MYDDHHLRKCAATTCCSSYINDVADVGGAGFKPGSGGGGPPGGGGGGFFDPPSPGDSGGPGPGGGGGGEQCAVDVSGPGTFIGFFKPWHHSSAAQAQLLSISRRDKSSRVFSSSYPAFLGANSESLRMNEKVVFRGTFVPDSALPTSEKTLSESPEFSSPSTPHGYEKDPENARKQLLNNIRAPSLLPKQRDLESRLGAPGGPGGENISILFLFDCVSHM